LVILPLTSYAQPPEGSISATTIKSSTYDVKQTSTVTVNSTSPVVCFTEDDTKKIVVDLENSNDYREQVEILKEANVELEKQIISLKEINKLQQEQLEISKQTIESYKNLLNAQKEAYEKEIENNKPNIWEKIFVGVGAAGIGVLIGLLL
jgi:predicted transcriptional regulator